MDTPSLGHFYAIGVGPGDPELLTLRALRLLKQARVIAHAGPRPREGRAFAIVESHLRDEQETRVVLTEAMSVVSGSEWRPHYRPAVDAIAADCRAGRDVAFITEGDPTVFSTAAYVWLLLSESHPEIPIEVIPGVTSVTAAAARVAWPLALRDQPFAVVPAHYHAEQLRGLIAQFPTVCLLKPKEALPKLVEALAEYGAEREAVYLENVGTSSEWITRNPEEAVGRDAYFSLVLVRTADGTKQTGGKVAVVGIGPGDVRLLTYRAQEVLRGVEAVVGYDAYLQALAPLGLRAEMRGSPIGKESERAHEALTLAQQGKRVALVSSGDAGVYGMASLLLETAADNPPIEVDVIPGVTAATAAAALLGAPLGHDFACISLSDLLTPWETIETRLDAAGRGDFVLAFYNPISQRRTWQLPRAREILLRHRRPETPVGLVDRAYRPGARVWMTTLSDLTTEGVGMETLLIVGNSQTRVIDGRMVTPRGYTPTTAPERTSSSVPAGRRIMEESFAIIDRELGDIDLPPWAFAVARRMIHASADFDFARLLRYSADFEEAIRAAFRAKATIVTDVEMVRQGIAPTLARLPGMTVGCHLNDPEASALAQATGITRSAAGIRLAARRHAKPLLVVGNAPTALDEALRLIEQEDWRPTALIAMPVGFVGVVEAKERLLTQTRVPYLTCSGRKGGSGVAAAAVNALAAV